MNRPTTRHRHHSLAGADAERPRQHHDYHLARPSLPEHGLHPHGGSGLRRAARLSGQLRRIHDGGHPARERLLADNAKKKRRLPTCSPSLAASAPTPLNRVRPPRARVRLTKSSWKRLKPPAVRTRLSASSRTRNCSVTRWKWKPSPKALKTVRCSKTSTCCWKWARRLPFWAPTAWVNPRC